MKNIRIPTLPLDEQSQKFLKEISGLPNVEEVIVLPDSFTKDKYIRTGYKSTIPSSIAIATKKDILYPQFRSRGINCGMMVIALPLRREDLSPYIIHKIFKPFLYNFFYLLDYKLRTGFIKEKYDLNLEDFNSVLEGGANFFAEKFHVNDSELKSFERNGKWENINLENVKQYLNSDWLTKRSVRLRHSFGRYFGGNHFFEIQEVVENIDTAGIPLEKGQLVIMCHTAGDSLEDVIKPELRDEYIRKDTFVGVEKGNVMYDAFFIAQSLLMNYGYAYRLATFALVKDLFQKHFSHFNFPYVVLDKSHNHVTEESIENKDLLVYRHNAERLKVNEYAILSGSWDAASYIVKGGLGTNDTLFTVDHGLGHILESSKNMAKASNKFVNFYRYKKGLRVPYILTRSQKHPIIENKSIESYFTTMRENDILSPVATLRPVVNMKFV